MTVSEPGPPTAGIPEGVDPAGVPRASAGHDAFVMGGAILVALLGLIATVGWIVYHQLVGG
jgi:hypothetical protein